MTTRKKADDFNFEKSLDQLNKLVEKMEQGDLPLEKSLQYFEQGVALIRNCQKALTEAEQKVEILMQNQNASELKPYDSDDA